MGACLFKNAIKPEVDSAFRTLYTAPSNAASLLLQLNGSVVGASSLIGSARIFDFSENHYSYLIRNAPIPTGDAIRLIDQAKIVLEAGDRIEVKCESAFQTIDYIGSLIEDINDTSETSLGIYKNRVVPNIGNAWVQLYVAPEDKASFVLQINAANNSESGVQVSVRIWDHSQSVYATILDNAQIPTCDAIRLIDHSKIVLEAGDKLEVRCNTLGQTVDVVGSVIEDVNRI